MANCAICGTQTSWLSRIKHHGLEFCGSACSKKWHAAQQTEADELARLQAEEARLRADATAEERRRAVAHAAEYTRQIAETKASAKSEAMVEASRVAKEKQAAIQKKRKADWKAKSSTLTKEIDAAPNDAALRTKLAKLALDFDRLDESKELYLNALAIGFVSANDEALAEWGYADVLWRKSRKRTLSWKVGSGRYSSTQSMSMGTLPRLTSSEHIVTPGAQRAFREAVPEVIHHVGLAGKALRSHLRWNPDDVNALKLLKKVVRLLGQDDASINQQIEVAERRKRISGDKSTRNADRSGVGFEARCLALIRSLGWRADVTRASGDGGIDILAHSDDPFTGGRLVIQCKDWAAAVGEPPVRDLLGVVVSEDAVKGVLITSGTFTEAARRFAAGKRLELIDGAELSRLERRVGANGDSEAHDATQSPPVRVRKIAARKSKIDGGGQAS